MFTKLIKWLKPYASKLESKLLSSAKKELLLCAERTDDEYDIAAKRLELAESIYRSMQERAGEKLNKGLAKRNLERAAAAKKLELIEKELQE